MKISIKVGVLFGIIVLVQNILNAQYSQLNQMNFAFALFLLFISVLTGILWVKRQNNYAITLKESIRNGVQIGLIQSVFYFISLIISIKFIKIELFDDSWRNLLISFNFIAIAYAFFSLIYSLLIGLIFVKKTNETEK
ncbi:MAG: hypothetical protein MUE53_07290 [Chitinophagales bacterium]|jgi:hypothetical protein|nr:hypothetical protein [Chitinophagales bacterium]